MCLSWLASCHDAITQLDNPGHFNNRFWLLKLGLKAFIGQKDKKLKDVR